MSSLMANYQSHSASSGSSVKVKEERHDEAEIAEMAAKMKEDQKTAAAKSALQQQQQQVVRQLQSPSVNQTNILNFLQRKPAATTASVVSNGAENGSSLNDSQEDAKPADEESIKGHFGWESFSGGKIHIPYIIRQSEKYCAVRIIEQKLLNKYLNYLHQDLYNCTCVRSYYITEAEARLLNEINTRHCDLLYGKDQFTTKDLIVRLTDAQKFSQFLDVCYKKLLMNCSTPNDKCGFIRINNESVVPYTVREGQKMVPLFYFEGETDNLKLKADSLSGWDLSYLKFCCKVQGIRNELFASDTVAVISLDDIKSYFPQGTVFEDYWPNKVVDSQLLLGGKASQNSAVHWTRQPAHPPPKQLMPAQQMTKTQASNQAQVRKIAGNPNLSQQQLYTNEVQQQYLRSMQSAANGLPQQGLSAAVQAISNNWSNQQMNSGIITQNQIDHVLRLTAAKSQQSQAAVLRQYANNSGRNNQMQNILQNQLYNAYTNGSMGSTNSSRSNAQQPPPLVRSSQTSQQAAAAHMSSGSGPSLLRPSGAVSSTLNPPTSASHTSRANNNVVTITRCPPTQPSFGSRVPASTTITPSTQSRYQNPSSLSIYPKSNTQTNGHMSLLHSSSISPVIQSPTRASPQSSQAKQPISPASPMRNLHPQLLQHQIESLLNSKSLSNYSANDILKETLLLSQLAGQQFQAPSKPNSSNAMNLNYLNSASHSNPSNQSSSSNSYPSNYTGQRLKSVITSRAAQDVIDLSSPPRDRSSTQQAAAKRTMNGNYMNQSQASRASMLQQQAVAAQQAQHQLLQDQNGRMIHLPEMGQNTHYGPPYKVQKTLVDNTMVTCINMAPFVHTDLLMPLSELRETFYPQISLDICRRVLQALEINLYKGNRMQYKAYLEVGKQIAENVPLVQVRDIIQHIPQLNYMVRGHIQEASTATKRARIS